MFVNSDENVNAVLSARLGEGWVNVGHLNAGGFYKWISCSDLNINTEELKIQFWTGEDIYEVVVVDESGETIQVESVKGNYSSDADLGKLVDEQDLFEYPPTFKDYTYFDEIYYVRAAQDYIAQRNPSEWTHPPLGKLILTIGEIFSFSPFGWRVMSLVFATLMIPVVYFAGLLIFKNRFAAAISAFLLVMDFMHFTLGRIGIIDTFLVFFSTLSLVFFYMNFELIIKKDKPRFLFIFLGALFASLAITVKWTSIFGAAGQVFLIIFTLLFQSRDSGKMVDRIRYILKPIAMTFLSFLIGGLSYLASYIPYLSTGHSLMDLYNLQRFMLNFHAVLPTSHPFASKWVTWPLMLRPMRFFLLDLPGDQVSMINAMGNPFIWWFGLAAVLIALIMVIKDRHLHFMYLVVIYFFQLLPFAFLSRDTYIYYYYPEVPILVLLIAGILNEFWREPETRKYIILYLVVVTISFVAFYPVISGYPAPYWYFRSLKWFQAWDFLGVA
jgi:dolichyl-phosphate-mannose-protein mannosyltransferase